MSEENLQKPHEENAGEKVGTPLPQGEGYEFIFNRVKGEITLRDPAGQTATIKATVVEEEDEDKEDDKVAPLTPEQFHDALQRINDLGLTWTADRIPRVKAKSPETEDALLSAEYNEIQAAYPALPRELSAVVFNVLTGTRAHESIVGGKDDLEKKAATVRELIISPAYRAEFFFRHAIKVPYFETIDWEVVFKTHERNVDSTPAVAYALLMLTFHNTNPRVGQIDEHQNVTVAVNLPLVERLMLTLYEIREALKESQKLTDVFNERLKDKGDATTS